MSRLSEGLDWALSNKDTLRTVYDVLKGKDTYEPREVIQETPRVGYPEGQNLAATNNTVDRAAGIVTMGQDFYEQVKGLFGLGYPASNAQPVSPVKHEISTPVLAGMSAGTIAIIAIGLLFLVKMK